MLVDTDKGPVTARHSADFWVEMVLSNAEQGRHLPKAGRRRWAFSLGKLQQKAIRNRGIGEFLICRAVLAFPVCEIFSLARIATIGGFTAAS